ncbi:uncharacterized protein MICPUCDRAFT_49941 [Micromonas pusilla CCMP1545]|uniref:Predicted protein n=1 Tax=Micromonas pusilla (strain CCMP1545) TaxID=564608 RepID=C1MGU2_MICPC|nr:uncharacterized protein MICPUCDRAFT_49941 [Micromonas pusilla CCMP1545]EEH60089.1 predicted protein [Micromonas pusilla CCMP1545]|eukprot:XP_003054837.1 predicted protein [Micromonas pusilla CCMP1545]
MDVAALKVVELRAELKKRGQPTTGRKAELAARLRAHLDAKATTTTTTTTTKAKAKASKAERAPTARPPAPRPKRRALRTWVKVVAPLLVAIALEASHGLLETFVAWQHDYFAVGVDPCSGAEYDVAIVLGHDVMPNGDVSPPLAARVDAGVKLFCEGTAKNLLFSGASGGDPAATISEANAMMNHALRRAKALKCERPTTPAFKVDTRLYTRGSFLLRDSKGNELRMSERHGGCEGQDLDSGCAPFRWVMEESSTSTRENAIYALTECGKRNWTKVAVVTNRFHQWRADGAFHVVRVEISPIASGMENDPWIRTRTIRIPREVESATMFPPLRDGFVARFRELWRAQYNVAREVAAIAKYNLWRWV